MKVVKISLVIIVVVAIVFFVTQSLVSIDGPAKLAEPKNQFTQRIDQEIDSLKKLPNKKFCKDFYKEIVYHIDTYHKEERLGTTPAGNNQWKENLSSDLYNAYADRFIEQAFYVFKKNEWPFRDLSFIRSEYKELQKSNFLKRNSEVDKKLTEIKSIFSKYDEIVSFITNSNKFSYSNRDLSATFPVSDIDDIILRKNRYLNNNLENSYVNNCSRLRKELEGLSLILFKKHVEYLDEKIEYWSKMYSSYKTQSEFINLLYVPLRNQIELLNNNVYGIVESVYEKESERLLERWRVENNEAIKYYERLSTENTTEN